MPQAGQEPIASGRKSFDTYPASSGGMARAMIPTATAVNAAMSASIRGDVEECNDRRCRDQCH